jgi:quercetin dioxygenase-like cupin family protein
MRNLTLIVAAALFAGAFMPAGALAQDAARDGRHCKVIAENEHVRVLEFTLPPGEKDTVHTHPAGVYVVTSPGKMKVTPASGAPEMWESKPGETAWMNPEGAHSSENVGKSTISFVLVEVKGAAKK